MILLARIKCRYSLDWNGSTFSKFRGSVVNTSE